jgi:predicted PurR-regulated permease PerM
MPDPQAPTEPHRTPSLSVSGWSDRDVMRVAAKATAAAIVVAAVAFGLWNVRRVVILLLLALTFAAAMRPGVEWLRRRRVPEPLAILAFFIAVIGILVLFFWFAVPPAVHQIRQALAQQEASGGVALSQSTGVRHDVLVWVERYLHQLPSGQAVLHPVASYGQKATDVIVGIFFTLAATWYWVSERDRLIELLASFAPAAKRDKARQTYLMIDHRLGAYTRLKFLMVGVIGVTLSAGFSAIGLNYWLLVGGFVSLVEIIPVIGPLAGALLVVAVGLPQSIHVAVLGLVVLVAVREVQSYVINPHVMGRSVGLSPLVTLAAVAVVGVLFGGFAVVLAIPAISAAETLVDVFVLDRDLPPEPAPARHSLLRRSKRT